jgi:hypothetical protein
MSAYIERSERSQISDLILQLKLLEKREQANPKTSRRREIIKIMAEINEIETKRIQIINETKSWFFEKINKIDRLLAYLTKMRREKTQISISERGDNNKPETWKSSETTLRAYILINLKILKKWTYF